MSRSDALRVLLWLWRCSAGVIWTMKFSKNGKYLASAGQDAAVRVWEVCLNRGEAKTDEAGEQASADAGVPLTDADLAQCVTRSDRSKSMLAWRHAGLAGQGAL